VIKQQLTGRELRRIQIKFAPIEAHLVRRRSPITELGDAASNRDTSLADPLLDAPARSQAGSRQQFLQSDHLIVR
jgi:hypothetical protein